ncbi:malate dehydrogenase (quinone) [Mycobacterium botniense]|uniref:Probable malate:quinone oxidoreductase n=1 Tax=Mycobacterium botniense TaxID=84962 RepID=A0A7I9Y302_9MYCO|nr:malate dehydrogenase (quinone) [Mycobacterium botniense]GFG76449.1 putative malate:quinone oxidoreductase [Mycobacterium botniense]
MPDLVTTAKTDVVLVGAGIMSATLGALLCRLQPDWSITLVERLDAVAAESSDPWHNAGTGHSALCELYYTPQRDGAIDIAKAVHVNEQFQVTRQFWAYAAENGMVSDVRSFLNPVPHVGFVHGAGCVDYLRRRWQALVTNPLFADTEFIDDADEFARRLPFMAAGRDFSEPIALTWAPHGTDVDFGALATQLIGYCTGRGMTALFGYEVRGLSRQPGGWALRLRNRRTGENRKLIARFVFVGAGGAALPLLQKSGIDEVKGFAGFPVAGKFLRSRRPSLTRAHRAKVYGLPAAGAPAMTAPHLDLRIINGQPWLLFGPFAGWSPKFLRQGHVTDLLRSIKPDNLIAVLGAGVSERKLAGYLIGQLRLSKPAYVNALREFAPSAVASDWETMPAGQRVQVIRQNKCSGVLEFDTTVLAAADGSIAGVLGASPGASTAVSSMLEVLQRCFADRYPSWLPTLTEMVPSLGTQLSREPALFEQVWSWGTKALGLESGAEAGVSPSAQPTAAARWAS